MGFVIFAPILPLSRALSLKGIRMDESSLSRPEKVGLWIASKFENITIKQIRIFLFLFLLFTHGLYWLSAWWSPWGYIGLMAFGMWFGQGIFKPWIPLINQSMQPHFDPVILKIAVPFIVINYIALFACLYMLGSVVDGDGNPINGMWQHFYFSAVTLTTLGYGNLTPNDTFSEVIATIEAIIGFMGFAVLAGVIASIILKRTEMNNKT